MNSFYTKKAFSDALLELLKTTPLDEIRVQDICETCKLSKKTFYYHFSDKYNLALYLYNSMETENLKEFGITDYLKDMENGNPNLNDCGSQSTKVIQKNIKLWHIDTPSRVVGSNLLRKSTDFNSPYESRRRAALLGRKHLLQLRLDQANLSLNEMHMNLAAELMCSTSDYFYDRWLEDAPEEELKLLVKLTNNTLDFWVSVARSEANC